MAEFTEWSADLEAALAEPFPAVLVERKRGGISFVAWHHYTRKLNRLVGPGWSMGEPVIHVVGGKLIMGIPITILGVTRINFGDEDEESEVNEEGKPTMYGTPCTNAFAQCYKRTLALFGMGLDMYDKKGVAKVAPAKKKDTGEVASAGQIAIIRGLLDAHIAPEKGVRDIERKIKAGLTADQADTAIEWLKVQPKKDVVDEMFDRVKDERIRALQKDVP